MNYLNRKSNLNLGWHSGNSHVDWNRGKEIGYFQSQRNQTEEIAALFRAHWENLCLGHRGLQPPLDSVYLFGFFPVQSGLALHTTLPNPEPTQLGDVEQR